MRNITMSADDQLIDRARKKAARENTTLKMSAFAVGSSSTWAKGRP